jgi:hypothetical protein
VLSIFTKCNVQPLQPTLKLWPTGDKLGVVGIGCSVAPGFHPGLFYVQPFDWLRVVGNSLFLYPEEARGLILLPGENRRDIDTTNKNNPELVEGLNYVLYKILYHK